MDVTSLRSAATVLCFITFVAIVVWAMARRNHDTFNQIAQQMLEQE